MVTIPKTRSPDLTASEALRAFDDSHIHMLLLTDGRLIGPDEPLRESLELMNRVGVRRLAVTDADHTLLGLVCLKRTGSGFCPDAGVAARSKDPTLH